MWEPLPYKGKPAHVGALGPAGGAGIQGHTFCSYSDHQGALGPSSMVREGPGPTTCGGVTSLTHRATIWCCDHINSLISIDVWWKQAVMPLTHKTVTGQQIGEVLPWSISLFLCFFPHVHGNVLWSSLGSRGQRFQGQKRSVKWGVRVGWEGHFIAHQERN